MKKKDWNDNETIYFINMLELEHIDEIYRFVIVLMFIDFHIAIFDLTPNERMNELACWMKHVGCHVQTT